MADRSATRTAGGNPPRPNEQDEPDSRAGELAERERNLDKTIADSFPASDPPSTDPNPEGEE